MSELRRRMRAGEELVGSFLDLGSALAAEITAGAGFDWLVPAFRLELVTALIRSLPKDVRRSLVPVPDVAASIVDRLRPRKGPIVEAIARELEAVRGVRGSVLNRRS